MPWKMGIDAGNAEVGRKEEWKVKVRGSLSIESREWLLCRVVWRSFIVRHNNEVDAKETKQFYENSQFSESRKFVSIKTEVS